MEATSGQEKGDVIVHRKKGGIFARNTGMWLMR